MDYGTLVPDEKYNDGDKAKFIIKTEADLKTKRYNFEYQWQEIKELVRYNTVDFNRTSYSGDQRTLRVFNTTATSANNELASGLGSYCTSPIDRFFNLSIRNKGFIDTDPDIAIWLEHTSDKLYKHFAKPQCNFYQSLDEVYLDLGAFGTSILYQDLDFDLQSLVFKSFPLANCSLVENNQGKIDTCYRRVEFTTKQAIEEFGEDNVHKNIREEKDQYRIWVFIHGVYPRTDRVPYKTDQKNKKFASCWVDKTNAYICRESGFNSFPYHCPRWVKITGEIYGRSPAINCLPDIRMINEMEKTVIKAAQKIVDPPLIVDAEGFMLPIRTTPGGMIWKDSQEAKMEALETKGNIQLGVDVLNRKAEEIKRAFYVDWLQLQKNEVQMTATEVLDRRDEKLRLLAPILGRLQSELLGPLLQRSYELLDSVGEIDPAPQGLLQHKLIVEYVSPAARAQSGTKVTTIFKMLQEFGQVATVAPQIFKRINFDQVSKVVTDLSGVTRSILYTDEQMAAIDQKNEQQQMLQQGADVGPKFASAAKDLATAQSLQK